MKFSKKEIFMREQKMPTLAFEEQPACASTQTWRLTSFAGAILYQAEFLRIGLKENLPACACPHADRRSCFKHLKVSKIFGHQDRSTHG